MALTADRNDSRGKVNGRTQEHTIQDAAVIYRGAITANDVADDGQLIPISSTTAGMRYAGVAIRGGTGDDDDPVTAVVERRGTRWFPHSGTVAETMVGELAYAVDDEEVTDTPPSQSGGYDHVIGRIIDVDTSDDTVEVDLEDAAVRDHEGDQLEVLRAVSGELDHADFTDNADATGKIDTGIDLPANSLLVGFELNVTEAFDSDAGAIVADLGDGTDADLYNGSNQLDVTSIAKVGVGPDPAAAYVASAVNLTLTVEEVSDWGDITAGKVIVTALYIKL